MADGILPFSGTACDSFTVTAGGCWAAEGLGLGPPGGLRATCKAQGLSLGPNNLTVAVCHPKLLTGRALGLKREDAGAFASLPGKLSRAERSIRPWAPSSDLKVLAPQSNRGS